MKLNDEKTAYELKWKFFLDENSTYSLYMISFDDKGRMRNRKKLNPAFIKKFKKISLKTKDNKNVEVYKGKKGLKVRSK